MRERAPDSRAARTLDECLLLLYRQALRTQCFTRNQYIDLDIACYMDMEEMVILDIILRNTLIDFEIAYILY